MVHSRVFRNVAVATSIAVFAACSSAQAPQLPSVQQQDTGTVPQTAKSEVAQTDILRSGTSSVLATLKHETTVGSEVDPVTGDVNPYGLDVAKVTSGKIDAGDLVVCDFNDPQNVQGTGNSVLALHPAIGSEPLHLAAFRDLSGCNALATSPNGAIWLAAFSANDNPIVSASGALVTDLKVFTWHNPFGEAFVPPVNAMSVPAFYVSNAGDGTLVRVAIEPGPHFTFTTIVRGFPVNHGVPGSILGPSGLNYQYGGDRLYVVDGTNNALYAIDNISHIGANGITVSGLTFSGPQHADAHVIFSGAPLNGPISSALLPGGNIAVGNTLDPAGSNFIEEITPSGHLVFSKNVDTGAAGAIFGMAATGTSAATTKLYFNDDNDNTLRVLTP